MPTHQPDDCDQPAPSIIAGTFAAGSGTLPSWSIQTNGAPAPEPSTVFLFVTGLAQLAFCVRKRK